MCAKTSHTGTADQFTYNWMHIDDEISFCIEAPVWKATSALFLFSFFVGFKYKPILKKKGGKIREQTIK